MLLTICIIGGMIIGSIWSIAFEGYWEFIDVVLGAFLGLVVAMVLALAFSVALEDMPTTIYEHSVTELVALNDGVSNRINGTFFLGTGHVDSDGNLEYRFIYESEKGMTVGERRATSVYLKYIEPNETPRLVKYKEKYDSKFWDWLLGSADSWEVFYVPEGSITSDIMIDLA